MLSIQELKSLKKEDLMKELTKAQEAAMHTQMHVKTGHEKNTSLVKKNKKYVAQINTLIKEIDLEEAVQNANTIS